MTPPHETPPAAAAATRLEYARGAGTAARGPKVVRFMFALLIGSVVALLVALALPRLNRRSGHTAQDYCRANLHSVGQALVMYANENGGRYPDTVQQLYLSGCCPDPRILACPAANAAGIAPGATTRAIAASIASGTYVSFEYVAAGLTMAVPDDTVLAYDHPANHGNDNGNVLFADCHVERVSAEVLRRLHRIPPTGAPIRRAQIDP